MATKNKSTKKQEVKEVKTPEVKEEIKEEVKEVKEEKKEEKKEEQGKEKEEIKEEKKAKKSDVIGSLKWGKEVHQAGKHLKIKWVIAPVSKKELPKHIQKWLTNKGYGTNVYLESKEWLEKHHVDMDKLEELKKFINDRYL